MVMDANDMKLFIAEEQNYHPLEGLTLSSFTLDNPLVRDNSVNHTAWGAAHAQSSQRRLRLETRGIIHNSYADSLLQRYIIHGEHFMIRILLHHADQIDALVRVSNYEMDAEQDDIARYRLRFENAGNVVINPQE